MAATSTNKQPLLVDRVLHYVVNLDTAAVAAIDIGGTNTALLVVDGTTSDGAIIEDLYLISRGTSVIKVNYFLSTANDYLRPNQGFYIGSVETGTTPGQITSATLLKTLAPVPQVGSDSTNRALYIPRGTALWAARESQVNISDGPNLGVQGGWY